MSEKTIKKALYHQLRARLDEDESVWNMSYNAVDALWFNPQLRWIVDIQDELEHADAV